MLKKLPQAYYRFVGWDKIDIFDKSKKRRIADVGNRRFRRAYARKVALPPST